MEGRRRILAVATCACSCEKKAYSGSTGSNPDLCDPLETGAARLDFHLGACDFYCKDLPYTNGGRIP